jgi:hypothetical protein
MDAGKGKSAISGFPKPWPTGFKKVLTQQPQVMVNRQEWYGRAARPGDPRCFLECRF